MKENNGRAARRRLLNKISVVLAVFFCLIGGLYLLETAQSDNGKWRIRHSLLNKLRRRGNSVDFGSSGGTEMEQVVSAAIHLIDIDVDSRELKRSPSDSYAGVYGTFCQLNFAAHKQDPSSVPMFRDLQAKSPHCDDTQVKVDLREAAIRSRRADEEAKQQNRATPKALNLTAVVFHESRCGSTLVANTLIGMNPEKHRVYSESPPPITALKLCGDNFEKCSIEQAALILQDVLYLMSRTQDPNEERVFFKIQSIGSRRIDVFRQAFPTTPFLFIYREPVQVIMSHIANGYRTANCLRQRSHPPEATLEIARRHGIDKISDLDPEMYCAAHLATLTENALYHAEESDLGIPVNYNDLPDALYKRILPKDLGVKTTQTEIDRILEISSKYSKGRGNRKGEWQEDSEKKEEAATDVVKDAAKQFMNESYQKLLKVSWFKYKSSR